MKIAMFTDSFYPAIDGVIVSIDSTCRELQKRGHEVVIFAPSALGKTVDGPNYRIVWLPARRFGHYEGYRISVYPSGIVSRIKDESPDIIHSHGISFAGIQALIASRNTGIKNVLTYHTMLTEAANFYSPPIMPVDVIMRLAWIYQRNYLRRPHAVIIPTKAIQQELIRQGIVARRWAVIPTGVDCNRFSDKISGKHVRERLSLDGTKMLLAVGRIAKEKNLELMLQGFSRLLMVRDEVRLVIVGKGPAMEEYKTLAGNLGISDKVIFAGFVPDDDLPSYYAACDAFVIASRFETQGLVALEAMACAKPVAGLNHRALPEIIQDGKNGYLFEDDPQSFSNCLERALDDRDHVSREARKTAESYSIEICTGRLIELYKEISGKG
ncbi:MAG: glycosyltransferase [Thermoplasmata archaeon]|nr:glycosyltransferase [Thermoplasmata archaeon]